MQFKSILIFYKFVFVAPDFNNYTVQLHSVFKFRSSNFICNSCHLRKKAAKNRKAKKNLTTVHLLIPALQQITSQKRTKE